MKSLKKYIREQPKVATDTPKWMRRDAGTQFAATHIYAVHILHYDVIDARYFDEKHTNHQCFNCRSGEKGLGTGEDGLLDKTA